ncbi:histidine phosphatase family protein [Tsukamurella soli]|uniref:Phosphoglycerate mutase n=1 Tax=Tsukamurella soli TaxID=644556 RepID=A0ABP8JQN7_9ACTN
MTSAAQRGGWTVSAHEPTRLILLRHGQTAASVRRLYSGHGDPPLTEIGRAQAAAAAEQLGGVPIDVAYTSPLGRARETAAAVAGPRGLHVTVEPLLIETDFGGWEGLSFPAARERDPELHARWLADPTVPAPGGESFDEVLVRVTALRDRLVADHPAQTVLAVSHVTPIKTMLRIALGGTADVLYRMHLDLASVSIVEFYPDGGASVRLVNRTAQLGG